MVCVPLGLCSTLGLCPHLVSRVPLGFVFRLVCIDIPFGLFIPWFYCPLGLCPTIGCDPSVSLTLFSTCPAIP
jgi:hypothetical protein